MPLHDPYAVLIALLTSKTEEGVISWRATRDDVLEAEFNGVTLRVVRQQDDPGTLSVKVNGKTQLTTRAVELFDLAKRRVEGVDEKIEETIGRLVQAKPSA
jgi:hypothetical protein